MLESLRMIYDRLLEEVRTEHYRFLYHQFDLKNRLTGLIGPRGVGKTTLLIQYIKNNFLNDHSVFYFSADHIYFKSNTLYEFIEQLFLAQGITTFFVDEIHKYDNWSQELKNIYDGFPTVKIVFSGSSSLDLVKGKYDLSRRAKMYYLPGLSFREYLNFKYNKDIKAFSFEMLMSDYINIAKKLSNEPALLGLYHEYLKQGFYPYCQEDPLSYYEKILGSIEKTIYEDIASYYHLNTGNLRYLSKILNYIASIPPGNISTYNVGKNLGISDKTAQSYLLMLSEAGLVEIIYPAESGNIGLRKPEKVFFNNTNLVYAVNGHQANLIDIGMIRELAFVQSTRHAGLDIFYNKQSDYQIIEFTFEIGGKNKTKREIKGINNAFLVKDDIISATKGTIPLLLFGFLY